MRLALLACALGSQCTLRATPVSASFHASRSDPQRQCDCVLSGARAAPAADVCGIHDARDALSSLSSTSALLSVLKAPMACLPGGEYSYGNAFPEEGYAEEVLALERVSLPPFAVDKTEVTNALFSAFVNHTHHVTVAEQLGDSFVYAPLVSPSVRVLGALSDAPFWLSLRGASWRAPVGPGSTAEPDFPAVHVAHADAAAFCAAAGKRLPREREWEYAARGGLASARFTWGNEGGDAAVRAHANTFRGAFPWHPEPGVGLRAVGSHPPNGFGVYDAAGNAWEWTDDDIRQPGGGEAVWRPQRGGSFMCHARGCYRYRVAARIAQSPLSTACHVGFRCVADRGTQAYRAACDAQ